MSGASSKKSLELAPTPPWKAYGGLVVGIAAFFLSQFIIALSLGVSGVDLESLNIEQNLLLGLASSLLLVIIILGFAAIRSPEPRRTLGLVRPNGPILLKIITALGLFLLASVVVASLADALVPGFDIEQEQNLGLGQPTNSLHLIGLFALLVIFAPISEELLFRGVIFAGLKRSWGFIPAAFFTSVLFGLAHWQPNVALATAVLGWLLAWLYHKTGSLWSSIALHALKNAVAFILLYGVSGV